MTSSNFLELAQNGSLELAGFYSADNPVPAYCIAAALDCLFETRNVPLALYEANDRGVNSDGAIAESLTTFFGELGRMAFDATDEQLPIEEEYVFNNYEEFEADVANLREQSACVLIDTQDGTHSVGLKPAGEDRWQLVGIDQLVHVGIKGAVQVQGLQSSSPLTIAEVWEYMRKNNSPDYQPLTALVFPPEP